MENHTAKHFVLQLGSLISLYLSLSFLLVLTFGVINLLFPDAADTVWQAESASSQVRLGIAMVIVFFPTYLALTRLVNTARRKAGESEYLWLTKWLIYLSLLVGGAVLLGDLVAVIMAFLEGEITQRFILKATAVLVVIGAASHYYLLDARGYWLKEAGQSIMYAIGATLVAFVIVTFGFANIGTPTAVREHKLDQTQISDLQEIQWHIQDFLVISGRLPETLDELYTEGTPPAAPDTRASYRYELSEKGFVLCATFATESLQDEYRYYEKPMSAPFETAIIMNPENWEYRSGETCFERVVKLPE
ncbi:hypothetical protein GW937_00450 [Candidatus Kaiserbacteria bacterium]|nr:hypothetical protein [Candidatus Kaiserbacteria bacterium]NCT02053.1 hypothetical protein [Candidatus Parcubacteria bacterium]